MAFIGVKLGSEVTYFLDFLEVYSVYSELFTLLSKLEENPIRNGGRNRRNLKKNTKK